MCLLSLVPISPAISPTIRNIHMHNNGYIIISNLEQPVVELLYSHYSQWLVCLITAKICTRLYHWLYHEWCWNKAVVRLIWSLNTLVLDVKTKLLLWSAGCQVLAWRFSDPWTLMLLMVLLLLLMTMMMMLWQEASDDRGAGRASETADDDDDDDNDDDAMTGGKWWQRGAGRASETADDAGWNDWYSSRFTARTWGADPTAGGTNTISTFHLSSSLFSCSAAVNDTNN